MRASRRRTIGWAFSWRRRSLPARRGFASGDAQKPNPPAARGKKAAPAVKVNVAALTEKLKSSDRPELQAGLVEASRPARRRAR